MYITDTTTLLLFAKNVLGCESLEKINVVIDDNSILGYNFEKKSLTSNKTKQATFYSKIKQVTSSKKLDGISICFVDQTKDCLVEKYSSKFSEFLGDVQLLTEKDVLLNESNFSVEVKNRSIFARKSFDLIVKIFDKK